MQHRQQASELEQQASELAVEFFALLTLSTLSISHLLILTALYIRTVSRYRQFPSSA